MHTLLDDSQHLLYPVINLLIIILALPSGTTSELHRKLWDYLSSHALIRFGSSHPIYRMLGQLVGLFEQEGDEDEKFGLLQSVVSDAISHLSKRMEEDEGSSGRAYYDLVSLWYAEMLRSHRGHRCGFRPQLNLEQEDPCSILNDLSPVTDELGSPDLPLNSVHSYLLLDYGWQTSWQDLAVYSSCIDLLNAKEDMSMPADETEVNCLTAMALYHRAQCDFDNAASLSCAATYDNELMTMNRQHHELARHLLQEAVSLDWELTGASIYNVEGLLLLQEWCTEAGDWTSLEAARQRSETCLQILFGEWGV